MAETPLKIGKGVATTYAKQRIAYIMFLKGGNFLGAAFLLQRENGYREVVFHLICQGLEIVQKALLIAHDSGRYNEEMLKKISHDLLKGADELASLFGFKPLKLSVRAELDVINKHYRNSLFRYAGVHDVFGKDQNIRIEETLHRTVVLVRFGKGMFRRLGIS